MRQTVVSGMHSSIAAPSHYRDKTETSGQEQKLEAEINSFLYKLIYLGHFYGNGKLALSILWTLV